MDKKGQGLPWQVIIIGIIVLVVLVVLFVIFGQQSKSFATNLEGEETKRKGLTKEIGEIFDGKSESKVDRCVGKPKAQCTGFVVMAAAVASGAQGMGVH